MTGLTYCVLASGSSGNCTWVRGGGVELLIDAGISARAIERELRELGTTLANVRAVVCTHGHRDHVAGVRTLARRCGLELWVTAGTTRHLPRETPRESVRELPRGGAVSFGGLRVETVPTPHDIADSVALGVTDGARKLAVITDLGVPTPALAALARSAQGLVLEANHDVAMLEDGPYPRHLKQRIRGDRGHLSNAQSAELLGLAAPPGLTHLTLAHLSEHNNTQALARAAIERALERLGSSPALAVAEHYERGEPVTLGAQAGEQLRLFA